jgi:hypothetical protein
MDEKKTEKAYRLSINSNRLTDSIEQYPVEWLLNDRKLSGYDSKLEALKGNILCMDIGHGNYHYLRNDDKEKAIKLMEHSEIVDIVLLTIFQWFGTTVGKYEIGELMDEIRKLKHEPVISK